MATSGAKAAVYVSGTATSFTDEATTNTVTNLEYQITSTSKRVWDPATTVTVKVGGSPVSSTTYTLNRLTGTVTFAANLVRTVTVTGDYLPMSLAAEAKSYNYSINCQGLSDAAFGSVWDSYVQGLKTISGSLGRWASADTYFTDALAADTPVVLEFWSDTGAAFDFRVWASLGSVDVGGSVTTLVEEGVQFAGFRDVDLRVISA